MNKAHTITDRLKAEEFIIEVIEWVITREELRKKSNDEIGRLLLHHIWAHIPFGAQSELLDEAIDRLLAPETKAELEREVDAADKAD